MKQKIFNGLIIFTFLVLFFEVLFNKNLVFEYDVLACKGNSIEEKINDYLNSIDFVIDYFNK